MTALRRLLTRHAWLAASIVAAALLMRLLVPAGYMAVRTTGGIRIELCSGVSAPATSMPTTAMEMPGMHHAGDKPDGHAQPEMLCAFAALAAPSVAEADPLVLALAIAFILATVFRLTRARALTASPFLRPPSRGPPTTA